MQIWLTVAIAFAMQVNTGTQVQNTSSPINVGSSLGYGRDGGPKVDIAVSNVAGKPISALYIHLQAFGGDGKLLSETGYRMVADVDSPMKPGSVIRSIALGLPKEYVKYTVWADYVRFADGTQWGPDTMRESKHISGFIDGVNAAEKRRSSSR